MLNGLTTVNIELTSRCNKSCSMCGRRKLEREHPDLCDWGDMPIDTVFNLAKQIPDRTIVQFHFNGEPLLYPLLFPALFHFQGKVRCLNTNGKLLVEKADEIIADLETLTVSVVENDPEAEEQYKTVKEFLKIKGNRRPFMIYRLLGNVGKFENKDDDEFDYTFKEQTRIQRWYKLPGIVATRVLHSPKGSFDYQKKVTIPEVGFCMDLFSHLVIDRYGDVYPCVRFNPMKYNKLGNVNEMTLDEMWNGDIRLKLLEEHIKGNRKCSKLCEACHFYGIPRGE